MTDNTGAAAANMASRTRSSALPSHHHHNHHHQQNHQFGQRNQYAKPAASAVGSSSAASMMSGSAATASAIKSISMPLNHNKTSSFNHNADVTNLKYRQQNQHEAYLSQQGARAMPNGTSNVVPSTDYVTNHSSNQNGGSSSNVNGREERIALQRHNNMDIYHGADSGSRGTTVIKQEQLEAQDQVSEVDLVQVPTKLSGEENISETFVHPFLEFFFDADQPSKRSCYTLNAVRVIKISNSTKRKYVFNGFSDISNSYDNPNFNYILKSGNHSHFQTDFNIILEIDGTCEFKGEDAHFKSIMVSQRYGDSQLIDFEEIEFTLSHHNEEQSLHKQTSVNNISTNRLSFTNSLIEPSRTNVKVSPSNVDVNSVAVSRSYDSHSIPMNLGNRSNSKSSSMPIDTPQNTNTCIGTHSLPANNHLIHGASNMPTNYDSNAARDPSYQVFASEEQSYVEISSDKSISKISGMIRSVSEVVPEKSQIQGAGAYSKQLLSANNVANQKKMQSQIPNQPQQQSFKQISHPADAQTLQSNPAEYRKSSSASHDQRPRFNRHQDSASVGQTLEGARNPPNQSHNNRQYRSNNSYNNTQNSNALHVSNIPVNCTQDELKELFKNFKVKKVFKSATKPSIATVVFDSNDDMLMAKDANISVEGVQLNIELKRARPYGNFRQYNKPSNRYHQDSSKSMSTGNSVDNGVQSSKSSENIAKS